MQEINMDFARISGLYIENQHGKESELYTRERKECEGGFSSALERENEGRGGVCNIGDFTPPSLPFGC